MRADYKELNADKRILVTGSAGFIGFHFSLALLKRGCKVTGFDNMNPYYDVRLKEERLRLLRQFDGFCFIRGDLADKQALEQVFAQEKPHMAVSLAAQAGVRNSITDPDSYIRSNIIGFYHVLECCRHYPVEHLVYASSSSVYGANSKVPYCVSDETDCPVSLYAATKKSDELMAYCYSRLYGIAATGLRFFTVYGPYGRPDMAYYKFADKIMRGEPIQIYNNGDMMRDFTYVDDIVAGMLNILPNVPLQEDGARHKIYNIGNHSPENLMDFIQILESCLGREAEKEFLPMQPGDVLKTYADVTQLMEDFDFCPHTPLREGLMKFASWYLAYRKKTLHLNEIVVE